MMSIEVNGSIYSAVTARTTHNRVATNLENLLWLWKSLENSGIFFSYTLWPPCEKGECIFMNENGDYFGKSNVISIMIAVL